MTCDLYDGDKPCKRPAVETLIFVNPLTAGCGALAVCATHLAEHAADHLLAR